MNPLPRLLRRGDDRPLPPDVRCVPRDGQRPHDSRRRTRKIPKTAFWSSARSSRARSSTLRSICTTTSRARRSASRDWTSVCSKKRLPLPRARIFPSRATRFPVRSTRRRPAGFLLPIPAEAGYTAYRQRRTVRGRNGVRLPFGRQSPGRRLRSDALIYAARLCRGGLCSRDSASCYLSVSLLAQRRGWLSKLSFLEKPVTVLFGAAAFLEAVVLFVFPVVVYWMVHLLL